MAQQYLTRNLVYHHVGTHFGTANDSTELALPGRCRIHRVGMGGASADQAAGVMAVRLRPSETASAATQNLVASLNGTGIDQNQTAQANVNGESNGTSDILEFIATTAFSADFNVYLWALVEILE